MNARKRIIAVAAVAALSATHCTLQAPDVDDCQSDGACRAAFGLGSVCGSDGRCGPATPCNDDVTCRESFGWGSVCAAYHRCTEPQRHLRCSRTYPEDLFDNAPAYRDYLVVGSLFSYETHLDTLLAAELAIRQVDDIGGLDGRRFAIVHCDYTPFAGDSLGDLEATTQTTAYLVDVLGVPVIVGPRGSDRTLAAFEVAEDAGVLVISPSATSPLLTGYDTASPTDESPGLLWRTVPADDLQATVIAADMVARGTRNVAIIFEEGIYGQALADLFVAELEGLEDAPVTAAFPFSGDDFLSPVATVGADADVEEVLFISPEIDRVVGFLNAASANSSLLAQYREKRIFLPDSGANQQLLDGVTHDAEQLFEQLRGTRPASTIGSPLYNFFSAAYELEFPGADAESAAFNPHSYDAAWLALYGIAWALYNETRISGLGIARGLRHLSDGRALDIGPVTWPLATERFARAESIDIQGTSGALDFDPDSEETTGDIEIWVVVDPDGDGEYEIQAE